jgi:hypothetical protein
MLCNQAEVYRSDFAAERSARERVLEKSEAFIERILELEVQVRNLQSGMNGGAQTGPVGQPHPQPAVHWRRQRAGQRGATATDEADGAGLNDPIDDVSTVLYNRVKCMLRRRRVGMLYVFRIEHALVHTAHCVCRDNTMQNRQLLWSVSWCEWLVAEQCAVSSCI